LNSCPNSKYGFFSSDKCIILKKSTFPNLTSYSLSACYNRVTLPIEFAFSNRKTVHNIPIHGEVELSEKDTVLNKFSDFNESSKLHEFADTAFSSAAAGFSDAAGSPGVADSLDTVSSSDVDITPDIHTAIVGHGIFSQGLLSALEEIIGKQTGVEVISNRKLSAEALSGLISKKLVGAKKGLFVFVDLLGGSCFNVCRSMQKTHGDWIVIAGVNLSMLVTYFNYRLKLSGKELAEKTLKAGMRGIASFEE